MGPPIKILTILLSPSNLAYSVSIPTTLWRPSFDAPSTLGGNASSARGITSGETLESPRQTLSKLNNDVELPWFGEAPCSKTEVVRELRNGLTILLYCLARQAPARCPPPHLLEHNRRLTKSCRWDHHERGLSSWPTGTLFRVGTRQFFHSSSKRSVTYLPRLSTVPQETTTNPGFLQSLPSHDNGT